MLLRTMYVMELIEDMIRENKSSTLREMYYISEGWGKGKFHSQDESNLLAEDLEVVTSLMREDFKLRPEENGASVIGDLTIEELNRKGKEKRINCRDDVGDSGYGIPYNVEKDKVKLDRTAANFIIAIETRRYVRPAGGERLRRGSQRRPGAPQRPAGPVHAPVHQAPERGAEAPVVVFTDGDPWSFRIFASVAYGAIKTAHISEYLATPTAEFIGITASDIENYDLPTDKLTEKDVRALEAEKNDPRFADEFWRDEIDLMLKLTRRRSSRRWRSTAWTT